MYSCPPPQEMATLGELVPINRSEFSVPLLLTPQEKLIFLEEKTGVIYVNSTRYMKRKLNRPSNIF